MALFEVGDTVTRVVDGLEATVVEVIEREDEDQEATYELEYAEGGGGFWPESSLEAA